MSQAALLWITSDDTGMSSQHIWAHMMGGKAKPPFAPLDPDDFGRCYRLLCRVPEWRARIGEMAQYSKEWAGLVSAWDELTALWEEEIGTGFDRRNHNGSAPRLYARMQQLRGDR